MQPIIHVQMDNGRFFHAHALVKVNEFHAKIFFWHSPTDLQERTIRLNEISSILTGESVARCPSCKAEKVFEVQA